MTVRFRNVDASPSDPVERCPAEAVRTALERGGLRHWRRLIAAIDADPWGSVARRVEEAIANNPPYGTGSLMADAIAAAREAARRSERAAVATQVAGLIEGSGLGRAEFARRAGTSACRLSTYLAGTLTPSAALVVRMRRLARACACASHDTGTAS